MNLDESDKQSNRSPCFIQLNNLSKSYTEGNRSHSVLKNVNLNIERGQKVALLGRSGSGKSTLLNLISGIDGADAGSVTIEGQTISMLSEQERTRFRRRHIGFVYQFFNLLPNLTAFENVALILELNGFSREAIRQHCHDVFDNLGIDDKADCFPSQLSGGEQQRVAIARALVHKPKIVLADEPTGNLDAISGKATLKVLNELVQLNDSTLLLVTHSLAVAKSTDRIITLDDGVIAERNHDFAW